MTTEQTQRSKKICFKQPSTKVQIFAGIYPDFCKVTAFKILCLANLYTFKKIHA